MKNTFHRLSAVAALLLLSGAVSAQTSSINAFSPYTMYGAEKKPNFEQAMTRLEEIVALLERGEAPLEQSLTLFEEGSKLLRQCTTLLDKAEQKVTKLTAAGETPFAPAPAEE